MPILDKNDNEQVKKYKEYIEHNEYARLTQSLEWTKVKNQWQSEAVYIEDDGKITGAMSILIQKVPLIKSYFLYAPRGPVCDPYDIDKINRLVKEADLVVKKYNAFAITFDPVASYDKTLEEKYIQNGYKTLGENPDHDSLIQPFYDAILDIDNIEEEELMKKFSEKTRYNIRLSKRKGIEVYYSREKEDLKTFYELYKITCQRDKIGCRAYEYFERMLESFDEEHLRIYIAKHEDDKLSAAIAINYGPEMFYLYGASSNVKRNLMPNYAMQWEMIKWGLEKKCKIYNFGGIIYIDKENGLYKFKTGFCKEEGIKQYIGEITKVYNKPVYFMYRYVLPLLKKIKRKLRKK